MTKSRSRGIGGFTLIELMIAMFLFIILGMALVTAFNAAMEMWESAEYRRDVYATAQYVIDVVESDLKTVFVDHTFAENRAAIATRFKAVRYEDGSKAVTFVTTLRGENYWRSTYYAGSGESTTAEPYTVASGPESNLLPLCGLVEVCWYFDNVNNRLYRGLLSPPGAAGTFFAGTTAPDTSRMLLISDNILYFDMAFFNDSDPASGLTGAIDGVDEWDSTKRDIWPARVRVSIVPRSARKNSPRRFITDPGGDFERISVTSTRFFPEPGVNSYIKIGSEWMRYMAMGDFHIDVSARGERYTPQDNHDPDGDGRMFAETGIAFTFDVMVPAFRENWNDRE